MTLPKPAFFVQNNYVERLTVPVASFAREHGIALEDRSSFQGFDPDDCGIDWSAYSFVLTYGSVQFLRKLKASALAPFILHDEARFATSAWAPIFGTDALNGSGVLVPAGQVADLITRNGPLHLRPDTVDKAFVGGVFDSAAWAAVRGDPELAGDLACWASPGATINAEWRCWIVGGKVVEVSKYREAGEHARVRETGAAIHAAAQRLADRYVPAPCVVLDVARVAGRYVLVEFNPIHCSGWYAADVAVILDRWLAWGSRTYLQGVLSR
jgi:hypothetical protein